MVANFSLPMGEAYTQPLRRVRDRRGLTAHAPESSFNVSFQIRASTFYRRDLTHYSHRTVLPGGDPLHHHDTDTISYRPVTWDDIHTCCQIAATSFQEDEIANFDNLTYMQQYAGEYFWCASLPADEDHDHQCKKDIIIGFISSSRCMDFAKECISKHDPKGSILAIHSVVVDPKFQYQDIATAMMQNYLTQIVHLSNLIDTSGFQTVKLLARSDMLSCYVDMGFLVLRPSPISRENGYELEARQDIMKSLIRDLHYIAQPLRAISRSTSNPDEGIGGTLLVIGREQRRAKLHNELSKLGIDPYEIEHHQERFGTAAIRTYNSFLLPKSAGALAVAESPTRPRVVANNISFLVREFKADQERWLRNVDLNRSVRDEVKIVGVTSETGSKHPITIILDNIRSAHNVGNILRLAEATQVDSVRLCGMTPRPPHPKV